MRSGKDEAAADYADDADQNLTNDTARLFAHLSARESTELQLALL